MACDWAGLAPLASAGVAFVIGFGLRVTTPYRGWEEPLAKEPAGVYRYSDGRPLLGRKLKGKSVGDLRDPGLLVDDDPRETDAAAAPAGRGASG